MPLRSAAFERAGSYINDAIKSYEAIAIPEEKKVL